MIRRLIKRWRAAPAREAIKPDPLQDYVTKAAIQSAFERESLVAHYLVAHPEARIEDLVLVEQTTLGGWKCWIETRGPLTGTR